MLVALRLPEEVVGRIDAASGRGGRSEFIRGAIDRELARCAAPKVEDLVRVGRDEDEVLRVLQLRPMTVREVARTLGWAELKADRVAQHLLKRGLVSCPGGGGMMVAA